MLRVKRAKKGTQKKGTQFYYVRGWACEEKEKGNFRVQVFVGGPANGGACTSDGASTGMDRIAIPHCIDEIVGDATSRRGATADEQCFVPRR